MIDLLDSAPPTRALVVSQQATVELVAYGGGTDSTGLLIGMVRRGMPAPHAILFADTGGEKPETYAFIGVFSDWLEIFDYPRITVLRRSRRDGKWESLEDNCTRLNVLPSVAYGYKTCSQKYKVEPQEKWANNDLACRSVWKNGGKVRKIIGYDYGELGRARFHEDKKYEWVYPLIDWKWKRADCAAAIARAGLPQPAKSACFFCPHSRKAEILTLRDRHPALLARALEMESAAHLRTVKGLGRRFNWRQFLAEHDAGEADAAPELKDMPCVCFDGDY